ncbi:MAG: exonuclease SbcCD subunit D [Actinomycetota bacterium]
MRLLHTGDWHVGKAIRGRSRHDEFAQVLAEVVGIAQQEGVDAVLIAGDLYEHRVASPDADALVFETLVRLHEARIPVVAISGNHDSALRLQAFARVLRSIDVHAVPRVAPPDRGSVVEIPSRDGSEAALVACVPFVPERRFGDAAALFDATETWYQSYAEGVGRLLGAMAGAFRPDRPNVLMAHLFTDGALLGGGEREVKTGLEYAVSPSRLPGTASYIALGHIHKPQPVKGAPAPARYSGSLLQLDFGEREQGKSVTIVDVAVGKPAKAREVPLSAGRKLVDVTGTFDEVAARGPDLGDAYLRVFLNTEGPVPGVAERVREALPNALDVHLVYERADADPDGAPVSSLAPREQFLAYFRHTHGAEPDETLLKTFDEVLVAVQGDSP